MSSDGINYNEAAEITRKLEGLRQRYISCGGSSNITMWELRSAFSKIIPYLSPNWYRHWSEFAFPLVENDRKQRRTVWYNDRKNFPTTNPHNNRDYLFIFNPSSDSVIYPPDGVAEVDQQQGGPRFDPSFDFLNPLLEPSQVSQRRPSQRQASSHPQAGPSNTQARLSNTQATGQYEEHCQYFKHLPGIIPVEEITTNDRIEMLSIADKDANDKINMLMANQHKGKEKNHHHRSEDSSESSSSSTKEDKKKKKFAFISKVLPISIFDNTIFTEGARAFTKDVKGYKTNIALAVQEFNQHANPAVVNCGSAGVVLGLPRGPSPVKSHRGGPVPLRSINWGPTPPLSN